MEGPAVAGSLPGGSSPLAQLAAALGPSLNESEEQGLWANVEAPQGGQEAVQDEEEAQEAADGGGDAAAAVLPISLAARMFVDACEALHVHPHPQLVHILNKLENEAYAPAMLGLRLGKGGAVLRVPPNVLPEHVQALVALLSGRCGSPPLPGQRSSVSAGLEELPPVGDLFFLRCLHLDLSGCPVPTPLLRELLATGPVRREAKSLTTLRGLDLWGCQLAADVVNQVLLDWKAGPVLERLQWLVLADNPQLGRYARPAPHQRGTTAASVQQLQQAAAEDAFLGAVELRVLASRLLGRSQLRLLDLRRTGFPDVALGFLMRYLAAYPVNQLSEEEAKEPQAPLSNGCRFSLECLKLGPPADCPHFSQHTVDQIAHVLAAAPRLQAVEVLGLTPESAAALLPVWQRAQQARGRQGYAAPGSDGGLRLTVNEDNAEVPAERAPQQHAPLQPPTPEPQPQQQHEVAAAAQVVEQEVKWQMDYHPMAGGQAAGMQQQQQQQGATYWHRQGQGLRAPRTGVRRQQAGGGVQFAGLDFEDDDMPGRQPAAPRRQHGGGGGAGGGGGGGGMPGRVPRPRGEGPRRSKPAGQRRRAGAGAGGGGRSRQGSGERMYRGGAREDELPVGEVLLGSEEPADVDLYYGSQDEGSECETSDREFIDDDLAATQPGSSSGGEESALGEAPSPGGAAAPGAAQRSAKDRIFGDDAHDYSSVSEYEGYKSDDYSRHYQTTLKELIGKLKERETQAGKRASKLRGVWELAKHPYDRRRWQYPSRDQEDTFEQMDTLLQLQELLAAHRLYFRFPFPRSKRKWVRAKRARAAQQEQQQQQQQQQQQGQQQQQQGGGGRQRRLQTVAQLERRGLEDSQEGDSEGATVVAPTQRQLKRKVVLDDSDSDGGEAGGSSSSSSSSSDEEDDDMGMVQGGQNGPAAAVAPPAPAAPAAAVAAGEQAKMSPITTDLRGRRQGKKQRRRPASPGLLGAEPADAAQQAQQTQQQQQRQQQQQGGSGRPPAGAAAPPPAVQAAAVIVPTQVARAAAAEAAEAEAAAVQRQLSFASRGTASAQGLQRQRQQLQGAPGAGGAADEAAELETQAAAGGSPQRSASVIVPDSCSEDEFGL
ncbi:hypothetical protein ABPG75_002047 [Micractinium tetrahymenae]